MAIQSSLSLSSAMSTPVDKSDICSGVSTVSTVLAAVAELWLLWGAVGWVWREERGKGG